MTFLHILIALEMFVIGHAIADFPLQGHFLAEGKNRFHPLADVPWFWCLGAHAAVHAGFVWVFTVLSGLFALPHGVADLSLLMTTGAFLGLLEFLSHFMIDDLKCMGRFSFNTDQLLHLGCKAVWATMIVLSFQ